MSTIVQPGIAKLMLGAHVTWVGSSVVVAAHDRQQCLDGPAMISDPRGDGVRVNIAPQQQFRLLAADVLASKGIERAIEDRAMWRADERGWFRNGKLPKPGWWR
jgi:hypothetical protein